jgi:hypothetical protein
MNATSAASVSERRRIEKSGIAGVAALALIGGLSLLWTGGHRPLGNDSFYYLEFAKRFVTHLPNHFGGLGPFGYPVVGALFSHLTGMTVYRALFLVSLLSFATVVALAWWALNPRAKSTSVALLALAACCSAPAVPLLVATPMSEPLFSALLFCLAVSLGYWPSRWAIVLTMVMMLGAFSVRYAGVFAFGMVPLYALTIRRQLRETGRWLTVLLAYVGSVSVAAAFCYSNYRVLGHISGQPVGQESLLSWPIHLADFGWGLIGTFFSGVETAALRSAGGTGSPIAMTIGLLVIGGIFALLVNAWRRSALPFVRPMVLLAGCYVLSIVTLRATTPFDAVSSPRMFVPALFPLSFILIAGVGAKGAAFLRVFSGTLILAGAVLAGRGMSAEAYPDVSRVREELRSYLQPSDTVAVNGESNSLAAWFPNYFAPSTATWGASPDWDPNLTTYTVIAMRRATHDWDGLIGKAISDGRVDVIARNANYVILKARKVAAP